MEDSAVEKERRIVLVDLDAFYASVEEIEDPSLRGLPLLIGGSPESRGVVAAASYEARRYGCHSAMPMSQALRLCPHATVLATRHHLYRDYSQRVMALLEQESPLIEQMSIDEAYVDLSEVADDAAKATALAHRIQGRIRVEFALPCSIGLATSKMVAKVACETGKPSGFVVVPPGSEAAFLAGLPVDALPGIGPRSAQRLRAAGLSTLSQVAEAPMTHVMSILGPWGAVLHRRALGQDESPVRREHEAKSISSEETFPRDVSDAGTLYAELERLGDSVARSLESHSLVARTVTLKLRFSDFTTITRSASRQTATADAAIVRGTARQLLDANWKAGAPVRLVGVSVSNLRPRQAEGQLVMETLGSYIT